MYSCRYVVMSCNFTVIQSSHYVNRSKAEHATVAMFGFFFIFLDTKFLTETVMRQKLNLNQNEAKELNVDDKLNVCRLPSTIIVHSVILLLINSLHVTSILQICVGFNPFHLIQYFAITCTIS